jgi:hypothetical protein
VTNFANWQRCKEKGILPNVVYFLRAGNFVKIGRTIGHPLWRVSKLQTGCPYPIELIGFIFADEDREAKLHKQFGHLRTCGEWFHAERELLICIDALIDSNRERVAAEVVLMRELVDLTQRESESLDAEIAELCAMLPEVSE